MKTELIRIGNSRGIRIPKPLIEQCGMRDFVSMRVENDCIIIAPDRVPRQGWDEVFQAASAEADDPLLESLPPNRFDNEEWRW